jgi:hypothetical protein
MLQMAAARRVVALIAPLAVLGPSAPAHAEPGQCHVVDVGFQPAARTDLEAGEQRGLQIVAWIEDAAGNYVDTIFITRQTGTFGIGNRPGRPDFNSGPNWPYGRRVGVFPVWAHRKSLEPGGELLEFPSVVFQDGNESNLSHAFDQSSRETHFCRPLQSTGPDKVQWDAGSCASTVFTDKGMFSMTEKSLYPPRQDITRQPGLDSAAVDMYGLLNPYDAVSQATPLDDQAAQISWAVPPALANGSYVLWIEASREFDHNATYSTAAYPAPQVSYGEFGEPYRGQPSVLYKVPFTIGLDETTATALDYAGYGDPDGLDGAVRAPDSTITVNVPGSGASRFAPISDGGQAYRVKVVSRPEFDDVAPGAPGHLDVVNSDGRSATVSFAAPGDDGPIGKITGYEVRFLVGQAVSADNFAGAIDPKPLLPIVDPGTMQSFTLDRLLPETMYSIGIRAFDDCHNTGPLSVITFTTPSRQTGEVDACFIATAAYGSLLAKDVEMLRRFRDLTLKHTVLGELFVETYYTFGPPVAGVVGESELLRHTARAMLEPVVSWVKAFHL